MEQLAIEEAKQKFDLALKAFDEKDFTTALTLIENALELHDNPNWYSYLGVCIAMERKDFLSGELRCLTSIDHDKDNPVHHLNLGKVYLAAGNKSKALETLRKGMAQGGNEKLLALLFQIGTRAPPFFSSLKRNHPLNKFFGIFLHKRAIRHRGLP